MFVVYSILIGLALVMSFFLIIAVLMQSSKGEGLAGSIGGAGGQFGQMVGSRKAADFLSKSTWVLGIGLLVIALFVNLFFLPGKMNDDQRQSIIQSQQQQVVPSTSTLPSQLELNDGALPENDGAKADEPKAEENTSADISK